MPSTVKLPQSCRLKHDTAQSPAPAATFPSQSSVPVHSTHLPSLQRAVRRDIAGGARAPSFSFSSISLLPDDGRTKRSLSVQVVSMTESLAECLTKLFGLVTCTGLCFGLVRGRGIFSVTMQMQHMWNKVLGTMPVYENSLLSLPCWNVVGSYQDLTSLSFHTWDLFSLTRAVLVPGTL